MIELTRLDGRKFVLNVEWIESFEATPETVISLTVDKRLIVQESVQEVLDRILKYKQAVFGGTKYAHQQMHEITPNPFKWLETEEPEEDAESI